MSSENGSAAGRRTLAEQAEALLRSLAGVLLARVIADDRGRLREVHALTDDSDTPGQTARNIQSALLARFGVLVDIDRIFVNPSATGTRNGKRPHHTAPPTADDGGTDSPRTRAAADGSTMHRNEATAHAEDSDAFRSERPAAANGASRAERPRAQTPPATLPTLDALEIERSHAHRVRCRLSIDWAGHRFDGSAEVVDGPGARAEAAARAAIAALNKGNAASALALEGIQVLEIAGRHYTTVALRTHRGRAVHYLAGAAPIEHSAEDAAADAAIQAAGPCLDPAPPKPRRTLAAAS
ncbi:MAG TPA: hypothetical protein VF212_06030 [Longimicrobiales bacterium]